LQLGPWLFIEASRSRFGVQVRRRSTNAQRDGSVQFVRRAWPGVLYGLALPHGWSDCDAAGKSAQVLVSGLRPASEKRSRLFLDDLVVGHGGAEAIEICATPASIRRAQTCQFGKQHVAIRGVLPNSYNISSVIAARRDPCVASSDVIASRQRRDSKTPSTVRLESPIRREASATCPRRGQIRARMRILRRPSSSCRGSRVKMAAELLLPNELAQGLQDRSDHLFSVSGIHGRKSSKRIADMDRARRNKSMFEGFLRKLSRLANQRRRTSEIRRGIGVCFSQ